MLDSDSEHNTPESPEQEEKHKAVYFCEARNQNHLSFSLKILTNPNLSYEAIGLYCSSRAALLDPENDFLLTKNEDRYLKELVQEGLLIYDKKKKSYSFTEFVCIKKKKPDY